MSKDVIEIPEWMEKYVEFFNNTGGWDLKELLNAKVDSRINMPVAMLQCCVSSQYGLLKTLHRKGLIK